MTRINKGFTIPNGNGEIFIKHHGATQGVTGSCHELVISKQSSILIDCGLFQGNELRVSLNIEFDIASIAALIVTHCHIDHVGRIPYLLAAGFNKPIYCSQASAKLLPLVIEDALKVGVTREQSLINACLKLLEKFIVPIEFNQWFVLKPYCDTNAKVRLQRAGHILGSAYVEIDVGENSESKRVVFSGDLEHAFYTIVINAKTTV